MERSKRAEIDLLEKASKKVTCHFCCKLLSVSPIHVKKDGTAAVCGRCEITDEDVNSYFRDERYEVLAQCLLFPCTYKANGCLKSFSMTRLLEHECFCEFKNYNCPSSNYTQCDWEGPKSVIFQHYQEIHPELIIENQLLKINFLESTENKYLMMLDNELFVVRKQVDSLKESFCFTVEHIHNCGELYTYNLSVENSDKQLYKCNGKSADGEDTTKWTLQDLREQLPNSLIVKIDILDEDSTYCLSESEEINNSENILNEKLLGELECPVCFEYMLPNIFLCGNGHSICNKCKLQLNGICPSCKSQIKETRNFALEKLTNHILYPCKFHKFGCRIRHKPGKIAKCHEDECHFRPIDCPLKTNRQCPWTGPISEIVSHVELAHSDFLLKNTSTGTPLSYDRLLCNTYLIIYDKKVFLFSHVVEKINSAMCSTWHMRCFENNDLDFEFRIDITYRYRTRNLISVTRPVMSYKSKQNPSNSIQVSAETFTHIQGLHLVYFVTITKINS